MATRTVTAHLVKLDGSPWRGAPVVFSLPDDTFRLTPDETYPARTLIVTTDNDGLLTTELVADLDQPYRVTLPDDSEFEIAVPAGTATTLEALRAAYTAPPTPTATIEAIIAAAIGAATTPPGVIQAYGGASAPSGWVLCDGAAVSRTTYAALFAVLGTSYGAGNGSTTFNVPNLQSRMPFGRETGQSANDTLGETGGARTVTLTAAQSGVPAHTHGAGTYSAASGGNHSHTEDEPVHSGVNSANGGDWGVYSTTTGNTSTDGAHTHSLTGASASNSTASAASSHENLPPFVTVNFIVKA